MTKSCGKVKWICVIYIKNYEVKSKDIAFKFELCIKHLSYKYTNEFPRQRGMYYNRLNV